MFLGIILMAIFLTGCEPVVVQSADSPVRKASATATAAAAVQNSTQIITPEPTGTPLPACDRDEGVLMDGSYSGAVYAHEIPYLAYLPPCYDTGERNYPVIYLLHGYPFDQQHWLDLDLVGTYEDGRLRSGWPDVIFILPYVPDPLFTQTDGGVGSYEQEFLEGLIPAISATFRISAEGNTVGGVSRGGVWALEIGLRNAGQFDHVFAISPALVYNHPRARYDPFQIVRQERLLPEHIFVSAAENETPFKEEIEAFVSLLGQQGIAHTFLLHPGNHNDQTWRMAMHDILTQFFADYGS